MPFNPQDYLIDLNNGRGASRLYLPTAARLMWFRDVHPAGTISTELVNVDPLVFKATIVLGDEILATGHGSAYAGERKVVWSGREVEKAETAAIGRALAHAGFGTQFADDDDVDHLADSPTTKEVQDKLGSGSQRRIPVPEQQSMTPYNHDWLHKTLKATGKFNSDKHIANAIKEQRENGRLPREATNEQAYEIVMNRNEVAE